MSAVKSGEEKVQIHSTARVAEEASLAAGCTVGPGAEIGPEVELGRDCWIGPGATLAGSISLGADNRVESNAILDAAAGSLPADIAAGSGNIFREYSLVRAGNSAGRSVQIGDDNFLMAYTVINPGVRIASGVRIANASCLKAGVEIGSEAFVAGMVVVDSGVSVGELAMLGGHSHLTADLPPFLLADGVPARVRTLNAVGLRRDDVDRTAFSELKNIFRSCFRSPDRPDCRLEDLQKESRESGRAQQLIEFMAGSDDICPGSGEE